MSKIIEFIAHENIVGIDYIQPIPIKKNIPEWYKKLSMKPPINIKHCMPFLDTLTSGYLLKCPIDYEYRHNVWDFEDQDYKTHWNYAGPSYEVDRVKIENININHGTQIHGTPQVEGSSILKKNLWLPVHKIMNPWLIKTPPGYSCLFLPPMNNTDERFSIIPGIVDTDIFQREVNFPFIINCRKDESVESLIKAGTPIVQVFPFKRDVWQMKISKRDKVKYRSAVVEQMIHKFQHYKTKVWNRKKWS